MNADQNNKYDITDTSGLVQFWCSWLQQDLKKVTLSIGCLPRIAHAILISRNNSEIFCKVF